MVHEIAVSNHSIHCIIVNFMGKVNMNSKTIYRNLCNQRKPLSEQYKPKSGLHRHHIIPRHSGGLDEESNYTYLTAREHIIAHYLLWRIYKNPNDLRAMKMLGAELTPHQRRQVGLFCKENKIGIWSDEYLNNAELQSTKNKKAANTQKLLKVGTFNPTIRKQICSSGGKIGGKVQKENKQGIHNPANFKKNASIGGKALKGMICVTNGVHRTRIRPEKLEEYINKGYKKGFTLSS